MSPEEISMRYDVGGGGLELSGGPGGRERLMPEGCRFRSQEEHPHRPATGIADSRDVASCRRTAPKTCTAPNRVIMLPVTVTGNV